jgi:hypothetical protein
MQNDHIERVELERMVDDGCPHSSFGDSHEHDLSNFLSKLGKNDHADRKNFPVKIEKKDSSPVEAQDDSNDSMNWLAFSL